MNWKEISTPRVADRLKFYLIYTPVLYSCSHYPKALSTIVVVLHRKVRTHLRAFCFRALSLPRSLVHFVVCVCFFLQVSRILPSSFPSLHITAQLYLCTRLSDSSACLYKARAGSYIVNKTRYCAAYFCISPFLNFSHWRACERERRGQKVNLKISACKRLEFW